MEERLEPQENKMGVMPINKLLITMSLPIIISMLVQACYNIVDSIFVAQISEHALTAVSLAFPAQNLLIAFGGGTAVGINALLARSLGEKNQQHANSVANHAIWIWIIMSVVFAIIGMTCGKLFFQAQTNNTDILNLGVQYFTIVVGLSFGLFGQFIFERLLQATGRTVQTMITQGTGAIINIILDPIFIFGLCGMPRLGVAGAAVATVIGQIVACILAIFINIKYNNDIQISLKNFKPQWFIIKRIYAISIPSIIMQSIGSVMTYGMNIILTGFSSTAAAVFGVYFKLQSFFFMPVFGLNNGLIPIVSYNFGARKKERMLGVIKLAMIYATGMMIIGIIVFETIPEVLFGFFNASEHMLSIGIPALRIIAIHFIFAGFAIVCSAVFQAVSKGTYSLIISLVRQLFVLLPVAYLLSLSGNVNYVWFSFPIAEICSLLISIYFLRRVVKSLNF
ncbi:MAG: MATE family efflux transporter [Faecalibacillus sp.]